MLTLSMEEINGQHCNSPALHRVTARGYIIIALYVVAQNMHGLLVALLYSGIAPLVHLRLLYALADSCQRGLYFFFCSGYHFSVFCGVIIAFIASSWDAVKELTLLEF